MGRYCSVFEKVGDVASASGSHNSVCPGFCPKLSRMEPLGVRQWDGGTFKDQKVGMQETQRVVVIVNL